MKTVPVNSNDCKRIIKTIQDCIDDGFSSFIIYPRGMVSSYVQEIVSKLGGRVEFYIDNCNYNGSDVLNIGQALQVDTNAKILISSKNDRCFEILRNNIYSAFDKSRIIDLFWMYEQKKSIETDDIFAGRFRTGYFLLDKNKKTSDKIPQDIYEELQFLSEQIGQLNISEQEEKDYKKLFLYIKDSVEDGLICRNAGNHFIPYYELIINNGIDGLIKRYDGNEEYENLLLKFSEYIIHYSKIASSCGKIRIMESCKRIAHSKPECLFDAIQLIILVHEVLVSESGCGSLSFGRVDQYLYPFYLRDINSGIITKGEAQEFITAFFRKLADFPLSWQNVTIGGSDIDGNDQSNDLTIMCMRASAIVRGDQPQLSLRIGKNTADCVWEEAINLISKGMGFPSLFNDDIAVLAKLKSGVREEDAHNYAVMGCVELCIPGKEYAHNEGARINWGKVLEILFRRIENKEINIDIKTFEDFYQLYKNELIETVTKVCRFIDVASALYPRKWGVPFASIIMDGVSNTKKDLTDNGTIYNNLAINSVGIATTADSLQAIKELVYERKTFLLDEMISICLRDSKRFEQYKKEMLACKKYGNDIDDVDNMAADLIEKVNNVILSYKMKYRNGFIMPGYYSSYFHADFGNKTSSTPDGREAYSPLSPSLSASSGMDKSGMLALFNSANKINMSSMGNGTALDIKFVPSFFDQKENREALKSAVETYFENGGLEVQINVVDRDVLIEAKKHPEQHLDLIVRVSGFSANFVRLDSNLQDEIIKRTEMR